MTTAKRSPAPVSVLTPEKTTVALNAKRTPEQPEPAVTLAGDMSPRWGDSAENYKAAAAARRLVVAAKSGEPDPDEIIAQNGKLIVTLGGKPVAKDRVLALFGKSEIDIPEVRRPHKQPA